MIELDAAEAWVDERLGASGRVRTGPLERFRERPWGEIVRVETDGRPVWLKAAAPATAFEIGIYAILADADPGAILSPLGIDERRRWVLLPDGGETLGERAEGEELVEGLISAMGRYGELQRRVASRVDDLLEAGVADMRPEAMPGRWHEAMAASERYVAERGDAEDGRRLEALRDEEMRFASMCRDLAKRPGRASLDHNDLHPWNVLDRPPGLVGTRFYDWGDAVVAHSFACCLVPMGFVERLAPGEVPRARRTYLGAFADLGPYAELEETLDLACHVAKVARALTWERALASGAGQTDPDFLRAPLDSLLAVADPSPWGPA